MQQALPGLFIKATMPFSQELVVRIHLPGTQDAKQAQLNIEPQKLSLTVAGKYHLQLALPHKVSAAEGTASFHSSKQQLEVVLPLVPPPISAKKPSTSKSMTQQQQQHSSGNAQSQDRGVSDAHELVESMDDAVSAAHLSTCVATPADATGDELPSMSPSQQHRSRQGEATARQERDQPSSEPLTRNQQKWLDLHPKNTGPTTSSDDALQASTSQAAVAVDTSTLRAAAAAGMWYCQLLKMQLVAACVPSCAVHATHSMLLNNAALPASCSLM